MLNFLFYYGIIISLIAFIGLPVIVLKHVIKQTKFTKFSYILTSIFISGFISLWCYIDAVRTGIWDPGSLLFTLFLLWFTIFSLVGLICLIFVHIVKKIKFSNVEKILLVLFILGLYSFIPRFLIATSFDLEMGTKLAIIPFDKQVGYLTIGQRTARNAQTYNSKDDFIKAIKYYEKAIHGKYSKFQTDSFELVKLYISIQDYEKALEIINEAEKNKLKMVNFESIKADVIRKINNK